MTHTLELLRIVEKKVLADWATLIDYKYENITMRIMRQNHDSDLLRGAELSSVDITRVHAS